METLDANTIGNDAMRIIPSTLLSADSDLSAESLTRKFGRELRQPSPIVYELARDPGLLHQYYQLRENLFLHAWGLQNFAGKKDTFDDHSDIMVARARNHCIGAGRLTFTSFMAPNPLPVEKNGFSLVEALPELNLTQEAYVEISRLAILPEYQNSVVMLELSRQLLTRAAERKVRYIFMLTPAKLARNYHKAAGLFGLEWQVLNNIHIPDSEEYESKMVLSMLDLAPVYRSKSKKKEKTAVADSLTAA